jgi:hypothetical protein
MTLGNTTYTFVMIKNPKYNPQEPYIYFISNMQDARAIAGHYLKRWKIECCFKHLKTNGFNLEDINVKLDAKIELMMAMLAMVYIIAVQEGLLSHQRNPIPLKKYKDGTSYLSISMFRLGFYIIQGLFTTVIKLIGYIEKQLIINTEKNYGDYQNFILLKNV